MGMIQKQGNWVSYELKPRDGRWFFTCEQLIQRQQRKGFLHRIVTGDEKWIFYDNPKKKKYYAKWSIVAIDLNTMAEHSWFDHALYLVGPKGSYLLWAADSWRFHYGQSVSATIDSFEPCIARKTEYEQRHDKIILLCDNAHVAEVVKKYLETLKWDVLSHSPYSPDIAPSDYWLFRRMQHDLWQVTGLLFRKNQKLAPKLDRLQKRVIFSRWNSKIAWEMGKSSRQRWTIL